jgi:hypothetical protein
VDEIDWSDVPGRVAALAARGAQVFGALGHGWELEPPLSAAELTELEAQLGVELPAEYRSFLLQVSRGGAGPFYGLFPVRRVDGRWGWEADCAGLVEPAALATPFPHTEEFDPAEGLPEQPETDDEEEEAWWEQHDRVVFDPANHAGMLHLAHRGCALREGLVISGPSRGQMWADETADDEGFSPLLDDVGERIGFARWYRKWLDTADHG